MRDFDPTASEYISTGYLASSSRKYDPVSIISSVAPSIIGGMMGNDASGNAADAQVQSSKEATQLQRDIFNQQRQDQAPFRQAGLTAQNRLMYLLGLSPGGAGAMTGATGGAPSQGPMLGGNGMSGPGATLQAGSAPQDVNALRAQLLPQFTSQGLRSGIDHDTGMPTYNPGSVDEAGLQAAMQQQQQAQQQPTQSMDTGAAQQAPLGADGQPDPEFGSLMKDFSSQDFLAGKDPGYQWRLDQGNQALDRSAAARGGLLSGRAMKDAMNYGQGAASQEYGAAFNRFQTNRSNKLNPLQSLMGGGQTATNQVGQAGQNFGNQAAQNIMGAGNAQASGIMGGANALAGGLTGGFNNYQQNQLMNKIWGPTGGGAYGGSGGSGAYGGFGSGSSYGNQDLGQNF